MNIDWTKSLQQRSLHGRHRKGLGIGRKEKEKGIGKERIVHFPPIFDLPFPLLTFSPPPPPPLFLLLARRLSLTGRQEVISSHVYRLPKLSGLTKQIKADKAIAQMVISRY